jgi:hypothetical protein
MENKPDHTPSWHPERYYKRHPGARPKPKENSALEPEQKSPVPRKPLRHRLLDLLEQPLFTLSVGIVGGIVGVLLYAPVLAVCGACVIFAFHRAKVVEGEPIWIQIPSYAVLCTIVVFALYGLHIVIDRKLADEKAALVKLIKVALFEMPKTSPQISVAPPTEVPKSHDAIAITQGTVWTAHDFVHGIYFVRFNTTKKITPINVMADYTLTNTKSTPILIKHLSLEMSGKYGTWWTLKNLPTNQQIWTLDKTHPHTGVVAITLPQGFLLDKIANIELQAGQSVRGWMLCQIPIDYVPLNNSTEAAPIRLRVVDTANDETVQPLKTTFDDNVLYTAMQYTGPVPGEDSSDYDIVPYGEDVLVAPR